jgi:hypothetical protein
MHRIGGEGWVWRRGEKVALHRARKGVGIRLKSGPRNGKVIRDGPGNTILKMVTRCFYL